MKGLNEEAALAIVFANTRRKKRPYNLIAVAKAFEYLVNLYGSRNAVAKTVGLSPEMVREFLTLLKLPKEVRNLFESRKIDSLDLGRELAVLSDKQKQLVAAKVIANLPTKDVRDIKKLIRRAGLPIMESKKMVLESKPKGLNIFIVDFDDETYKALIKQAKDAKTKPAELVREIVSGWLRRKEKRK